MIRHERPGVDGEGAALGQGREASDEVRAIGVVPEDETMLDPHTTTWWRTPEASNRV
jgi:hypothetical protein